MMTPRFHIRYTFVETPRLFEDFEAEAVAVPRVGNHIKICGIAKQLRVAHVEWVVEAVGTRLNERGEVVVPKGADVSQHVVVHVRYVL